MVREFAHEDDCRVLLVLDPYVSERKVKLDVSELLEAGRRFDRAVTLCAGLAWHFYERNAFLQFRSVGIETSLAPADEVIFTILRHLALAQPLNDDPQRVELADLAANPDLFKVIVTSQPRGSIPDILWHSSYVIFLEDLAP
jgi:uncharacterized protein (DUF58 family)